jgi:hypothetical protein
LTVMTAKPDLKVSKGRKATPVKTVRLVKTAAMGAMVKTAVTAKTLLWALPWV